MPAAPLLALALLIPAADGEPFPPREAICWGSFVEWRVEAEVPGNPYDVEAAATFTHADSGETIVTPLFYDPMPRFADPNGVEDGAFRFRFTGTRPGAVDVRDDRRPGPRRPHRHGDGGGEPGPARPRGSSPRSGRSGAGRAAGRS